MSEIRPGRPEAARNDPRRQAYYAEAASWSADIHGALRASRRFAWIVAGAAGVIAVVEGLALLALAPLKTVVPYTISVDRQTGYVETVRPLSPGALTQDLAVTQANLVQYVQARETFDATDLRNAYRKTVLLSGGDARADYERLMKKTTPESPLNLYSPSTVVSTTIESVSLLSPTTALIRFETVRRDGEGPPATPQPYVAAIAFRYTGAAMSNGDRFVNPLGFQVTRYRRDAETPTGGSPLPAPTTLAPVAPVTLQAPLAGQAR